MGSVKLVTPSGSITLEGEDTAGASTVVIPKAGVVEAGTLKEIGVDQVWTQFAVGSARVVGTTYTNNTGKPIIISVSIRGSTTANTGQVIVDSVVVGDHIETGTISGVLRGQVTAIVPDGITYSVSSGSTVDTWSELT